MGIWPSVAALGYAVDDGGESYRVDTPLRYCRARVSDVPFHFIKDCEYDGVDTVYRYRKANCVDLMYVLLHFITITMMISSIRIGICVGALGYADGDCEYNGVTDALLNRDRKARKVISDVFLHLVTITMMKSSIRIGIIG